MNTCLKITILSVTLLAGCSLRSSSKKELNPGGSVSLAPESDKAARFDSAHCGRDEEATIAFSIYQSNGTVGGGGVVSNSLVITLKGKFEEQQTYTTSAKTIDNKSKVKLTATFREDDKEDMELTGSAVLNRLPPTINGQDETCSISFDLKTASGRKFIGTASGISLKTAQRGG